MASQNPDDEEECWVGTEMRQQMWSLMHVQRCDKKKCSTPLCDATKKKLVHVKTCRLGMRCPDMDCLINRVVIDHWSNYCLKKLKQECCICRDFKSVLRTPDGQNVVKEICDLFPNDSKAYFTNLPTPMAPKTEKKWHKKIPDTLRAEMMHDLVHSTFTKSCIGRLDLMQGIQLIEAGETSEVMFFDMAHTKDEYMLFTAERAISARQMLMDGYAKDDFSAEEINKLYDDVIAHIESSTTRDEMIVMLGEQYPGGPEMFYELFRDSEYEDSGEEEEDQQESSPIDMPPLEEP